MVEECMNILNGNEAAANPPSRAPQLTNLTSVVTGQDDTLMPPSNNSSTPRYQQPINNNSPQVVQPRHLSYVTTPPTAHPQFGGKCPRRQRPTLHVEECSSCRALREEIQGLRQQLAVYEGNHGKYNIIIFAGSLQLLPTAVACNLLYTMFLGLMYTGQLSIQY